MNLGDAVLRELVDLTVGGARQIGRRRWVRLGASYEYSKRSSTAPPGIELPVELREMGWLVSGEPVSRAEAREVGEKAVQFAFWGDRSGSVAIKRTGFYSADYELLPLEAVAGKTRTMEDQFIAPSGTDITDAFRLYLRPLLGSDLPDAYRLRYIPVAKVLRP